MLEGISTTFDKSSLLSAIQSPLVTRRISCVETDEVLKQFYRALIDRCLVTH